MKLAITYVLLALVATAANIAAQAATFALHGGRSGLYLSMATGTAVGLVLKYFLDKRFIFGFRPRSGAHDLKTFVAYTFMGAATTALFWVTELAFWVAFDTDAMRYVGGAVGLLAGYWTKYHLDKRFVFQVPDR